MIVVFSKSWICHGFYCQVLNFHEWRGQCLYFIEQFHSQDLFQNGPAPKLHSGIISSPCNNFVARSALCPSFISAVLWWLWQRSSSSTPCHVLHKEEVERVNRHVKSFSDAPVIREVPIKTTLSCIASDTWDGWTLQFDTESVNHDMRKTGIFLHKTTVRLSEIEHTYAPSPSMSHPWCVSM